MGRNRRSRVLRWSSRVGAALVLGAATTWCVAWYVKAIAYWTQPSFSKSAIVVQNDLELGFAVRATRFGVRRAWQPTNIAGFQSRWHGGGPATWQASLFESFDVLPHAGASFGWLGATGDLDSVQDPVPPGTSPFSEVFRPAVPLPGGQGTESAFGWPFLSLSMGFYYDQPYWEDGAARVSRGELEPPRWIIDRLPGGWSILVLPTEIVWRGFLANTGFYSLLWLGLGIGVGRAWRRLRSYRPAKGAA